MASFFGEVQFPVSRAFWDDENENGLTTNSTGNHIEFAVQWLKEKPAKIPTLVIVESELLIEFARECLCPDAEKACVIEDEKQKEVAVFYQVNPDAYLCNISPGLNVKHCGRFIIQISNILSNVASSILITSKHVTQLQNQNPVQESSFLRMLSSRHGESICKLKVPTLEQPNIIHGMAAGVLSYAEFMDWPSLLYILYTDSFVLDSTGAKPLVKLFRAMNFITHDVQFTKKNFFNKGNLYM